MEILNENVSLGSENNQSKVLNNTTTNQLNKELNANISIAAAEVLKNAQILFENGEKSLALNLLRVALNRDHTNVIIMQQLAKYLEGLKKFDESIKIREQILKIDYGFMTVFHLAQSYYLSGNDQLALDKYYEALSIMVEDEDVLFEIYKNMGNIFVRQGDFEAAEEYYNKSCTISDQSDVLFVNYATLAVQRSDFDRARDYFRNAVEINPQNDKAWIGLAMVHNQFADFELAWANLEKGIDINGKNRTGVFLYSQWALRDQKYLNAVKVLESFLSEVECDEDLSLALINFYILLGNVQAAKIELSKLDFWLPESENVKRIKCLI